MYMCTYVCIYIKSYQVPLTGCDSPAVTHCMYMCMYVCVYVYIKSHQVQLTCCDSLYVCMYVRVYVRTYVCIYIKSHQVQLTGCDSLSREQAATHTLFNQNTIESSVPDGSSLDALNVVIRLQQQKRFSLLHHEPEVLLKFSSLCVTSTHLTTMVVYGSLFSGMHPMELCISYRSILYV